MRMLLSRVTFTRSSGGWFCFWAAALLVLPHCALQHATRADTNNLNPGGTPHSSAVFCDIERPVARPCATPEQITRMPRLAGAAVALVEGAPQSTTALDYSPDAITACSGPQVVEFQGPFPRGTHVCLNCTGAIGPSPAPHASAAAVCIAHCLDLFSSTDRNTPPSAAARAFCTSAHARPSTNFLATATPTCYEDVCDTTGGVNATFLTRDPRRTPEPVDWTNFDGVAASGGTLRRTAPTTGFADAGASSNQFIDGGDGYLQFTATETNTARAAGVSYGPAPLGGITFTDIGFGILLLPNSMTGMPEIHVIVNGNSVGTFGGYNSGDKFRVKLRDNFDGHATVSFARILGTTTCVDGSRCMEGPIDPGVTYTVSYPIRVDAMFREQNGTVTDAKIVRIR